MWFKIIYFENIYHKTSCSYNKLKNILWILDSQFLIGENTSSGNPATMKKRIKMKSKEKKSKAKVKDLPGPEEEDAIIPSLLSNSGLDQGSSFLGVDEESEE